MARRKIIPQEVQDSKEVEIPKEKQDKQAQNVHQTQKAYSSQERSQENIQEVRNYK